MKTMNRAQWKLLNARHQMAKPEAHVKEQGLTQAAGYNDSVNTHEKVADSKFRANLEELEKNDYVALTLDHKNRPCVIMRAAGIRALTG